MLSCWPELHAALQGLATSCEHNDTDKCLTQLLLLLCWGLSKWDTADASRQCVLCRSCADGCCAVVVQAVVGHPHVVALRAVYEDVHNLHMVMDWCGGGSLWQLMERCPGYMLPEAAAAAATRAVLKVLAHCHARWAARDIACFSTVAALAWCCHLQLVLVYAFALGVCFYMVACTSPTVCFSGNCFLSLFVPCSLTLRHAYAWACLCRGVMHRDIKPDNLLIAAPLVGPEELTCECIKVTDFGISVPFTPGQVCRAAGPPTHCTARVLAQHDCVQHAAYSRRVPSVPQPACSCCTAWHCWLALVLSFTSALAHPQGRPHGAVLLAVVHAASLQACACT
jgi:serine/threonine protein kinase